MANEQRLIDANALIKEMNAADIHFWHDAEDGVEMCVNIAHNAPTVDAVEVVRCRDCVQFDKRMFECVCCRTRYLVKENDYCSYGKRDGGNEDGKSTSSE